jgi:hypothetical protein
MADEKPNLVAVTLATQVLTQLAQEGVTQEVLELLDEGEPAHGFDLGLCAVPW